MLLILKKNIHVFNFKKEYPFSTVPLSLSELSTGSEKDTLQGRLKFRESHIVAVTSKILWMLNAHHKTFRHFLTLSTGRIKGVFSGSCCYYSNV